MIELPKIEVTDEMRERSYQLAEYLFTAVVANQMGVKLPTALKYVRESPGRMGDFWIILADELARHDAERRWQYVKPLVERVL